METLRLTRDALLLALVLLLVLSLGGCGVPYYSGSTKIRYAVDEQGKIKSLEYENNKDLAGLDVEYEVDALGRVKKVRIQVDKSGTNEAAIAAAAAQSMANARILEAIAPIIKAAATKGAGATIP